MTSIAELQRQQRVADAYYKNRTDPKSQSDYQKFTANNNRLIAEAHASQQTQKPTTTYNRDTTVTYKRTSDPTKPKIMSSETVITRETAKVDAVDQAVKLHDIQVDYNRQVPRGGTSPTTGIITGPNDALAQEAKITSRLDATEKQAYNQIIEAKRNERIIQGGVFMGAVVAAPVLGPVGVVKAATGSVVLSQAVNTGVAAYEGRDLSQSILTPSEMGWAAVSGVMLSGAVGVGLRGASVVAPRINLAAESALARSTRIFESSANRVKPGLGQATTTIVKTDVARLSSFIDTKEAQLASRVVNPIKYSSAVNRVVGGAVSVKDRAITLGQRTGDVLMPKGEGETASFMRGIVKPNLASYSKVAKTSTVYRDTQIGLSTARAELRLATKPATSTALKLTQNVKGSRAYTEYLYNKAVRSPNTVPKAPNSQIGTALYDNLLRSSATKSVKTVQKLKIPSANIKTPDSIKAMGKVAAGKTRYNLKLKTPEDKLLKSERTPLKFDAPTVEAKQLTVQVEKATLKLLPAKTASNLASGMPKPTLLPYPKTASRVREDEETTYLTYPGKSLGVNKPALTKSSLSGVAVSPISRVSVSPKVAASLVPKISPVRLPSTVINTTPALTPKTSPVLSTKTSPVFTSRTTPALTPITMPKTALKNPQLTPSFPVGGDVGWGGGVAPLTGKWAKRNTRIKHFDEMLGTFGMKTSKQMVSRINKMDNVIIGKRLDKKSRRKRKR